MGLNQAYFIFAPIKTKEPHKKKRFHNEENRLTTLKQHNIHAASQYVKKNRTCSESADKESGEELKALMKIMFLSL